MLAQQQVRYFRAEGYLLVPHFFDADEVEALRSEVARFRREGRLRNVATEGDGQTPTTEQVNLQLVPLAPHSMLFRALPFCEKVLRSASQLLGDPVVKILDQLFLKPARQGLPTNWHADNAYFRIRDPLKGAAMWIAVDDATRANGALKVLPGVFRDRFDHFRDLDSDHHIRMNADDADAVHCELQAGGVVFFCYGTPHATGYNETENDRTGIGVHFLNSDYITDELGAGKYVVPMTGKAAQREDSRFAKYAGRWQEVVQGVLAADAGGAR